MKPPPQLEVVLYSPRLAANVGAVGRICAAAAVPLHIVRPIPFRMDDRNLARAGMDYWKSVDWRVHDDWPEYRAASGRRPFWLLTARGEVDAFDAPFAPGDALVFGNEPHGAPDWLHEEAGPERRVRLPIASDGARCLNLATAVSATVYLAWRRLAEA